MKPAGNVKYGRRIGLLRLTRAMHHLHRTLVIFVEQRPPEASSRSTITRRVWYQQRCFDHASLAFRTRTHVLRSLTGIRISGLYVEACYKRECRCLKHGLSCSVCCDARLLRFFGSCFQALSHISRLKVFAIAIAITRYFKRLLSPAPGLRFCFLTYDSVPMSHRTTMEDSVARQGFMELAAQAAPQSLLSTPRARADA